MGSGDLDTHHFPRSEAIRPKTPHHYRTIFAVDPGLSLPLTYKTYKPDDILKGDMLRDGSSNTNAPLLTSFPYLAPPANGYLTKPPVPATS